MQDALFDPTLGHLTWDEPGGSWFGQVELLPGHRIDIFVNFDASRDSRENALAQARAWVARVRQRVTGYQTWTAEQLLGARWNLHEPMTVEGIHQRLRLLSVVCEADGLARLYWDDEDVLFCGHGFCTRLSTDGECMGLEE